MPDRVLRERWSSSRSLDAVSDGAERLFTRVLPKTDGAGRFEAEPAEVRSLAFPRWESTRICDAEIARRLAELEQADLVSPEYVVRGRPYRVVVNFTLHQPYRFRRDRIRCPAPPWECPIATNGGSPGGRPSGHQPVEEDTATRAAEALLAPARTPTRRGVVHSRAVRGTSVQLRAPRGSRVHGSMRIREGPPKTATKSESHKSGGVSSTSTTTPETTSPTPSENGGLDLRAFRDRLVAVYPRPANLHTVDLVLARLGLDAALQTEILAAVEAQKRWPHLARENGRFFPDLDKWLRREKWRDVEPRLHRPSAPTVSPVRPEPSETERAHVKQHLAAFRTSGFRQTEGDHP